MATLNTSPLASGEICDHASHSRHGLLWYACYIAPTACRLRCMRTRPHSSFSCDYICTAIEELIIHDQEDHGNDLTSLHGSATSNITLTSSYCSFGLLWFVRYVTTSLERHELMCMKRNVLSDLPCNYLATTTDQISDHDRRDHHYYWCDFCRRYVTIGEAGHHIERHSQGQEARCECYVCGDWLDPVNPSGHEHLCTPHTTPVAGSNLGTVVDSPVLNRSVRQTCGVQSQVFQSHGAPARNESGSTCSTPAVGLGFDISGLEASPGKFGLE